MSSLSTLSRREAVRRIALIMGGTLIGSKAILSGQTLPEKKGSSGFTDEDRALLDAIGDTIIPETDIPGAKAIHIGAFMAMMVTDCYDAGQQALFREGMGKINDASRAKFGVSFIESTPQQRGAVAKELDLEQSSIPPEKRYSSPTHYFRMMKELTILGFYSSEIGGTLAVRYIEVPGAFHGDIAYKKGDRAWF